MVSSEISRGLDIFELKPSAFISQNEIDAAKSVKLQYLNTQGQQKLVWPATMGLARAYLDQLERSKGLDASKIADARDALTRVEKSSGTAQRDGLTQLVARLEADLNGAKDPAKVGTLARVVRDLASAPADQAAR
jgi:hypothetical protein